MKVRYAVHQDLRNTLQQSHARVVYDDYYEDHRYTSDGHLKKMDNYTGGHIPVNNMTKC